MPSTNLTGYSKTQLAYQLVKEKITSGEFAPGHRIVLAPLAEMLNTSVVPVREALRQLEAEGLIEHERNVGARVAMVDRSDYLDCMFTIGVLEGAATAAAAPHLSADDLAHAAAINADMGKLLDNFDAAAFTDLNYRFHRALFNKCPNRRLVDLVESDWERLSYLRESTFAFVPNRAAESVTEHHKILTLIEINADHCYIEKVAREHRHGTLNSYLTSIKQHPSHSATGETTP
ncbi:GntR family transcriptional regulator [Corynebacterium aquilae]|uniref:GntR family transcriptional regulator n=1 Tax=Corynebacterium aquilae DSM 44791 TaxID=1431546 RepID=A0A1L7CDK3_9CORY|nr:GntR family transcriptional regulator [Corynebacterium aquilae]APT83925.1 GntR family transcriptional regulator [Corynebacterium aquilae DSM 44791]